MKKCKNCKNPFSPRFSALERFCWAVECKTMEAMEKLRQIKRNNAKIQRAKIKTQKIALMTVQQWASKAQASFNRFIRLRDESKGCVSCGVSLKGKKFDAGHFYNANNHWSLRFDEANVHAQCVKCNRDLHGNLLEYRKRIVERIGAMELERLEMQASQTRKYTRDELKDIHEKYLLRCKTYCKKD